MKSLVNVSNLSASIDSKSVLKNISLSIGKGEVHVILGPNGAGKSTLGNVLMGNPLYEVTGGTISFEDRDITSLDTFERAKLGMFLSFQQPPEIPGVTVVNFLRTSYNALTGKDLNMGKFHTLLKEKMTELEMDASFRTRELNVGFSGGERKRFEILQLSLFEPKFAILDEIDSGLDVDALQLLAKQIALIKEKTSMSILLITHHTKILEYLQPTKVHILKQGSLVESGGMELLKKVESSGFKS
jgi:Fe-S cluster assembly ATP-binding protein